MILWFWKEPLVVLARGDMMQIKTKLGHACIAQLNHLTEPLQQAGAEPSNFVSEQAGKLTTQLGGSTSQFLPNSFLSIFRPPFHDICKGASVA